MPKISVLTPSIRPEYLNITQEVLRDQTEQDFEWLVEVGLPHRGYTLSADLNKLLRRAKGELVVMLQDCIKPEKDGLERFWRNYQANPKAFITSPIGKVTEFGQTPKWDWRKIRDNVLIQPHQWEADWASAPLKAFYDIGGYDEDYDQGWSWENVGLAWRAKYAGYEFICDPDNPAVALDHDALTPNPFRHTRKNNDERSNATIELASQGGWKLHYLDKPLAYPEGEIVDRLAINLLKLERLPDSLKHLDPQLRADTTALQTAYDALNLKGLEEMKEIHARIWDLEADIRQGKEGALGIEEVGKRALQIRDINAERIKLKNKLYAGTDIKFDHASADSTPA